MKRGEYEVFNVKPLTSCEWVIHSQLIYPKKVFCLVIHNDEILMMQSK